LTDVSAETNLSAKILMRSFDGYKNPTIVKRTKGYPAESTATRAKVLLIILLYLGVGTVYENYINWLV